jgi:deazaflavin-dependent oxidoreductase (nitroreductase family)
MRAMNPLTPVAVYLGGRAWLPRLARYVVGLDRLLQRVSRGRVTLAGIGGLPNLVLVVRGRRTGILRRTPLLYVPHAEGYLVAGSNWGGPRPPAWVLNLSAASVAEVEVRRTRRRVVPRRVVGEERARVWPVMVRTYLNYEKYAARTGREIPVFLLEPDGD